MKKTILEYIERLLSVALSTFSCMGMFLIGNLIGNLITDVPLSYSTMFAIFLGSIILTFLATTALLNVRYAKLEIMVEELEREKEMQENFERMKRECDEKEKQTGEEK